MRGMAKSDIIERERIQILEVQYKSVRAESVGFPFGCADRDTRKIYRKDKVNGNIYNLKDDMKKAENRITEGGAHE